MGALHLLIVYEACSCTEQLLLYQTEWIYCTPLSVVHAGVIIYECIMYANEQSFNQRISLSNGFE